MKTTLLSLLAVLTLLSAYATYGQSDEAEDTAKVAEELERINKVAEEIERRRKERDERLSSGGAFQPLREFKDDSEIIEDLVFSNLAVSRVSQIYADMSQKEVLLSSKAANIIVSMRIEKGTIREVLEKIEETLSESGVEVVLINDSTVALVNAASK